jgi:hypothetical protein
MSTHVDLADHSQSQYDFSSIEGIKFDKMFPTHRISHIFFSFVELDPSLTNGFKTIYDREVS